MTKRKICYLTCLLLVCMLFCGAAAPKEEASHREAYERNEEYTCMMLEALMEGDQDGVLAVVDADRDVTFYDAYRHITKHIKGTVSYDLELLQNHSYTEEGVLFHRSNYRVAFSDRRVYGLIVYSVDGDDGLYSFQISYMENETAKDRAPATLSLGMLLLTVVAGAFVVWMIVDCIRRPMKKGHKVLWILLMLIFGGLILEWGGTSIAFYVSAQVPLGISLAEKVGGLWSVRIFLPVGALVYFFLRKKLTKRYLDSRKSYYDKQAPLDFSLDDQQ